MLFYNVVQLIIYSYIILLMVHVMKVVKLLCSHYVQLM